MRPQFGNYVLTFSFMDGISLLALVGVVYYLHYKHMFPLTVTAISTVVASVLLGFGLVAWAKKFAPDYGLTESQGLFPVDYFFLEIILAVVMFFAVIYYMLQELTRFQNMYLYLIGTGLFTSAVTYFWAREEATAYGVPSSEVWRVIWMI
jgi:hypothetical protein